MGAEGRSLDAIAAFLEGESVVVMIRCLILRCKVRGQDWSYDVG